MSAVMQHPFEDVDVHLMAVPARCTVAVDVPVAVHEILRITMILFAARDNITEIQGSCFSDQGIKFLRCILFCHEMVQMFIPSKKREGLCQVFSFWIILKNL